MLYHKGRKDAGGHDSKNCLHDGGNLGDRHLRFRRGLEKDLDDQQAVI
jgi:hypothetical protein